MRMGLRRRRSTHNPAARPKIKDAKPPIPARMPIWKGLAFRISTAISGRTTIVIRDPISEMVWPIHSFKKSRSRHRLGGREGMLDRIAHKGATA